MDTVAAHPHNFDEAAWPFADPMNAVAFSTRQVVERGYPVLRVSHDYDGDWQILCGTSIDVKDLVVVCFACAYQRDQSIAELAQMPRGWTAWRNCIGAVWELEQKAEEDDG